ncbi:Xylose isomerase domain protein TIM barrel [Paenibacillus curdlanolyticus YK9]|uniref:Xylose isomerase domain protein TIM barrel n=1 Tax=Paenibacillus curdlanolyticus YK9 TaxID=717606 RepID=E0I6N3_9BACL|nr:TIM barrel protein [Paenibacillus curdlanolyticus]EFM11699.1 Xylose isomerase domain protein TIM barrel [Paenibacillus curdlanolyticus YK9]
MSRLSISSWSTHRLLKTSLWTAWDARKATQITHVESRDSGLTLLELPKAVAQRGIRVLEACHFHFASDDEAYAKELRHAFEDAGVAFHTLLIDYGDLSSPDGVRAASDEAFIRKWIDVAAHAGAAAVRVVAGEQQAGDEEAIIRSAAALRRLYAYGQERGVRVVTENFRELTETVASWQSVMEHAGSEITAIVDFGNMKPEEKEQAIRYGAPMAYAIHAKPEYSSDGVIDEAELTRNLAIADELGCTAPISVIFDQEGDVWEGIEQIAAIVAKGR